MDKPAKNDPFYHLMKDSTLHLDNPELVEDIMRQLQELRGSHQSPHSPHKRPATRNNRMAILFLSIAVIWGLALTALYAAHNSPASLADPSFSLFLPAMLIGTFLFLLEKIIKLLFRF